MFPTNQKTKSAKNDKQIAIIPEKSIQNHLDLINYTNTKMRLLKDKNDAGNIQYLIDIIINMNMSITDNYGKDMFHILGLLYKDVVLKMESKYKDETNGPDLDKDLISAIVQNLLPVNCQKRYADSVSNLSKPDIVKPVFLDKHDKEENLTPTKCTIKRKTMKLKLPEKESFMAAVGNRHFFADIIPPKGSCSKWIFFMRNDTNIASNRVELEHTFISETK